MTLICGLTLISYLVLERVFARARPAWVLLIMSGGGGLTGAWLDGRVSATTLALAAAGLVVGIPLTWSASHLRTLVRGDPE
jgi:hypothetical protein